MSRLKTILCPIDFSQNSTEILEFVTDIAVKTKLRLAILHVPGQLSIREIHDKFEEIESEYFDGKPLNYEFAVGKGDLHDEILRFNKIFKTEFVTVGMVDHDSAGATQFNMTASWLIESGTCAVLAIPNNWQTIHIGNIALATQPKTRPRHWYVLLHLLRTLRSNVTVFDTGGSGYSKDLIATHCLELLNRKPKEIIRLRKNQLLPGLENILNDESKNIDMLVTMPAEGTLFANETKFQSLVSINKPILSIPIA